LFSSSGLFAGSPLLLPPTTPAPDSGKKAFESRMTETLGGSSLFQTTTPLSTTTPSTSPFSASLFGPNSLFSPSFLTATTPVTPPQKTEEEKKKEFDERMKGMGIFTAKTDTKSNDVATTALGSFSSILNLSAVPEKKEKTEAEKKKEFDERMASIFGKKPGAPVEEKKEVEKVETEEEKKKKIEERMKKMLGGFGFTPTIPTGPAPTVVVEEKKSGPPLSEAEKKKKFDDQVKEIMRKQLAEQGITMDDTELNNTVAGKVESEADKKKKFDDKVKKNGKRQIDFSGY